jgi:glyoxylase-like metal-dependent hydrolase (beta-lactamase superfamily II)
MPGSTRAILAGVIISSALAAQTPSHPAPPPSVRLYVFDCGTIDNVDPARFGLTPAEAVVPRMSVACFLVVHPKGTLIWDTGVVPDTAWTPNGQPQPHQLLLAGGVRRDVTLRAALLPQLAAVGYSPADITYLALSHDHYDHTANAYVFAGATWLVRSPERDSMFSPAPPPFSHPADYGALKTARTVIIPSDEYDVFGDGTVILKAAPGHTPGHQVLYVRLAHTGGVVLSGDLYHFPAQRTLGRLPVVDFDSAQNRASRTVIEGYITKLWIQHDYVGNASLRKAPAYYE